MIEIPLFDEFISLKHLLSMSFLSYGFLDSDMRGSSKRIWSMSLSTSVLEKIRKWLVILILAQFLVTKAESKSLKLALNWTWAFKTLPNDTYPGVRFNKSIDLVSISPLLFRYSKMIPGGWNLSKNLFNFIFFIIIIWKLCTKIRDDGPYIL